jgi:hypothetical protein
MRGRGFCVIVVGVGLLALPGASGAATIEVTTDADEFGEGGAGSM